MTLPDHVLKLRPVEVVIDTPTLTDVMNMLMELRSEIADIKQDIADTKEAVTTIVDNVKPTIELLSNGPIGQLLGISPPPAPRTRRSR